MQWTFATKHSPTLVTESNNSVGQIILEGSFGLILPLLYRIFDLLK